MLAGAPMLCCSRANIFSACVCVFARRDSRRDRTGDDYQHTQTRQSASFLFLHAPVYCFCWPSVDLIFSVQLEWCDAFYRLQPWLALRTLWHLLSHHTVSFLPSNVTTNRRQPPDVFFFHRPPPTSSSSFHTQWLIALPSSLPQHRFPHPLLLFSFF